VPIFEISKWMGAYIHGVQMNACNIMEANRCIGIY